MNLRKTLGTQAACPWDTRRNKQGCTGRCPRDCLLFAKEKLAETGNLVRDTGLVSGDIRPSRGLSENLCYFLLCTFVAPYSCVWRMQYAVVS